MRQFKWWLVLPLSVLFALTGIGGCSDEGGNLAGKVPVALCAADQHVCWCARGMYCLANTEGCATPETACTDTADLHCQASEDICPCYFGAYCMKKGTECKLANAVCPVPTE